MPYITNKESWISLASYFTKNAESSSETVYFWHIFKWHMKVILMKCHFFKLRFIHVSLWKHSSDTVALRTIVFTASGYDMINGVFLQILQRKYVFQSCWQDLGFWELTMYFSNAVRLYGGQWLLVVPPLWSRYVKSMWNLNKYSIYWHINIVQTFMFPRGWVLLTVVTPW